MRLGHTREMDALGRCQHINSISTDEAYMNKHLSNIYSILLTSPSKCNGEDLYSEDSCNMSKDSNSLNANLLKTRNTSMQCMPRFFIIKKVSMIVSYRGPNSISFSLKRVNLDTSTTSLQDQIFLDPICALSLFSAI